MEDRDLGQAPGLAAATGAYVCFEDEAGQNLRPPKARTWAPRGHTPVARVSGKGSGRVSVAGLACYRPGERSRLFYRARVHRGRKGERRSMSEADYAALVTAAHQQLHAPVVLIWEYVPRNIFPVMRPAGLCGWRRHGPRWRAAGSAVPPLSATYCNGQSEASQLSRDSSVCQIGLMRDPSEVPGGSTARWASCLALVLISA